MLYAELNNRVFRKIDEDRSNAGSRHRLIRYALDNTLLPNEVYLKFPEWFKQTFQDDDWGKIKWIHENHFFFCLFLVRLFFEETDGRSYNILVQNKLDLSRRIDDVFFSECVASGLLDPIESDSHPRPNTQKLLVECWVFMQGPTSEIWRSLIPLVRALPLVQETDELNDCVEDFIADHADVPFSLEYLAEKRDTDFIESLKCMSSKACNLSTEWQRHITNAWDEHGHGNSANIGWVIDTTPGRMRLLLAVRDLTLLNNREAIQFYQDGKTAEYPLNNFSHEPLNGGGVRYRLLSFTPRNLQEMHRGTTFPCLNPNIGFEVRYGKTRRGEMQKICGLRLEDIPPQIPLVFKWRKKKLYAQHMSPEVQRVSSPKLVLVWPNESTNPPRLKWGGLPLDDSVAIGTCEVQFAGRKMFLPTQVVTIPGDRLNGAHQLVWVNEKGEEHLVIHIGTRPMLEAENTDSEIGLLDSDTLVVFSDNEITLYVTNLPGGETIAEEHLVISGGTDCSIHRDGRSFSFSIPYATEAKCRYCPSNSGLRVIRFPQEIRNVILGNSVVNGWEWQDANVTWSNAADINRFISDGYVLKGTLISPDGKSIELTKPLDSVKFWWRSVGVHHGQITAGKKDFDSLAELRQFTLCIWVPESTALTFDKTVLVSFQSGPSEIQVHELINRDSDTYEFESLAKLFLGSHVVADIWQLPGRPSLAKSSGSPIVYFPKDDTFLPKDYQVVHVSENMLLETLRIDYCGGLAQDINTIHIGVADYGYWLILVKSSQTYRSIWDFCLDRNKYVEYVLEVKPPPQFRLEERLLGEQYLDLDEDERLQKLSEVASYLEFLATEQRAGNFPPDVLVDAISNRSQLNATALPLTKEFDSFFNDNCDLDHLCETLQTLLDHSINVFAQSGWCKLAFEAIRKHNGWKLVSDKRMMRLLEVVPEIAAILAVQEGFPCTEALPKRRSRLTRERLQSLDFLYEPNGYVEICCPTSIPLFQTSMKLKTLSLKGACLEHDRKEMGFFKERQLEFSFGRTSMLMDPYGSMHKMELIRIDARSYCKILTSLGHSIPNERPLFGRKAYRHGIHEAVDAPERFLSESISERLNFLFNRTLRECAPLLNTFDHDKLASFFLAKSKYCKEWEQEIDYQNRTYVWQAVIISRLNTWCPDIVGGILGEDKNGRLVCDVISSAFRHCRTLLRNDLVVVEWLITWYGDHSKSVNPNTERICTKIE